MKDTYKTFCDQVIAAIPRATRKEEQEIRQELLDHLEDHVLEMMERDWSEEEATVRAVACMGDPAEIGKAWNDQLSPFWLWVGRLAKTATILLLLIVLIPAIARGRGVLLNLEARWSDLDGHRYGMDEPVEAPDPPEQIQIADDYGTGDTVKSWALDERVEIGKFHIRFFQAGLDLQEDGYDLRVRMAVYPDNPLHDTSLLVLDGVAGKLGEGWRDGGGSGHGGAIWYYDYYYALGDERPESVNMSTTNDHGSFSVDFSIDWSDVP